MNTQQQEIEQLAASMLSIRKFGVKMEGLANSWFEPLKAMDVRTLDEANIVFSAAYELNGWSQTAGRPAAGAKEKPAPKAVKLYTTTFRKGYKLGLDVLSFETVGALREATGKKRPKKSSQPRPPELKGIQLTSENTLTGALWHDVVVLWEHLPEEKRDAFEQQVRKLLSRYTRAAPPELLQAA